MFKIAGNRERPEEQFGKTSRKPTMIKEHIIVDSTGADVGVLYPYRDSWVLSIYEKPTMIFDTYSQAIRYMKEIS